MGRPYSEKERKVFFNDLTNHENPNRQKLNPAIFNSTKFDVVKTDTRKPRSRKQTHDTHFHIPNELWEKIKYEAEANYDTFQQVIVRRLYKSYDADK